MIYDITPNEDNYLELLKHVLIMQLSHFLVSVTT